jgi:hypothetical protein
MVFRLVLAMMMGVKLACFHAMMGGLRAMAAGALGMMRADLGLVFFIVPGGLAMVLRGLFVMFGRRMMMCAGGVLVRHVGLLVMHKGSTHASNNGKMSLCTLCTNFMPRRNKACEFKAQQP